LEAAGWLESGDGVEEAAAGRGPGWLTESLSGEEGWPVKWTGRSFSGGAMDRASLRSDSSLVVSGGKV
jgi:hypothetical protein